MSKDSVIKTEEERKEGRKVTAQNRGEAVNADCLEITE